jgi:hypothetical protein
MAWFSLGQVSEERPRSATIILKISRWSETIECPVCKKSHNYTQDDQKIISDESE